MTLIDKYYLLLFSKYDIEFCCTHTLAVHWH